MELTNAIDLKELSRGQSSLLCNIIKSKDSTVQLFHELNLNTVNFDSNFDPLASPEMFFLVV